jgi:uncharacterized protein
MKLSRLFVYPVKACAGIELTEATVDQFGITNDRRWLIVDADGVALTQRDRPRMALLRPSVDNGLLRLTAPDGSVLTVQRPSSDLQHEVIVWNDQVMSDDAGNDAASWLSDYLEQAVRLVHMPDTTFRRVDPNYSPAERRVSFADAFPFLVVSQESMDELNRRLPAPMGIERFRPNIVVAGASEPHAEDGWSRIRIGAIDFDLVKPCARCAVPTIDQQTAIAGKEPSRTLATYRKRNGKIYFGQNAIHATSGTLRVGDPVIVLIPGVEAPAQTAIAGPTAAI